MKKYVLFLLFLFGGFFRLSATHNIAGEITLVCTGGLSYTALITTYTNSQSNADRCDLTLDWGDGTQTVVTRFGGTMTGCGCPAPATCGTDLSPTYPNTQSNTYTGSHTYSGPNTYTLRMIDPNRIAGIDNIQNSVNTPFVLQTTITVNPFTGCNSTPRFTTIPLDKACVNHCFYHNPGAVDPENDSLSYTIGAVLDTLGNPMAQPALYAMPDAPCNTSPGFPHGAGGVMTIDPVTGDLSWCSPGCQGKFNVAIFVHEWRKVGNIPVEVSVVEREMEIDVGTCNNNNPDIPNLPDLCVDAGTTLNFNVTVTDPDVSDQLEITAYGTAINANPPATVSPNAPAVFNPQPVNVNFNWPTSCDNVRLQPYSVIIKARDNDLQVQLLDIESFNITVVSPGPQILSAVPSGTSMNLNWSVNPCNPTNNPLIGYKIYRKTGPSGWVPQQCETGVPAYTGFVYIGTVTGLNSTSFVDNNAGAGLIPGVNYCYRVHAYFLDGAMSYASPEACNELKRDVPVISHVDVISTGTNDQMGVSWYNPVGDTANFDTLQNPGPYQIRIYRASGQSMTTSQGTLIATLNSPTFAALPDTFTDNGLLTVSSSYSYRVAFFANNGNDSIGSSHTASSVFLTATPSDNAVSLTWTEQVPWTNFSYEIYRDDPGLPVLYTLVGTTSVQAYKDSNLVNGASYCYYIRSLGSYFNPQLPDTLRNRSQEVCAEPVDLTPPCPPQLGVNSDCFNYINQLQWVNPMNLNCGTDDVVSYNIWYTPTEGGTWQLLAAIGNSQDTVFTQLGLTSVAGCYAVTAIDSFGNQSAYSNIVCVDNCPEYILPNVFTPDGDGTNDFFISFPYRYIESIDMKIFDRWGVMVFETTDPAVKWNGKDINTGKLCTDGVYYYICTVNEIRLEGIVPRQISGFFHLFSKDNAGPF